MIWPLNERGEERRGEAFIDVLLVEIILQIQQSCSNSETMAVVT